MVFILPAIFAVVVFLDLRGRQGCEKTLYIALSVIAVTAAVFAGYAAKNDHVGASLSGMISIFMR